MGIVRYEQSEVYRATATPVGVLVGVPKANYVLWKMNHETSRRGPNVPAGGRKSRNDERASSRTTAGASRPRHRVGTAPVYGEIDPVARHAFETPEASVLKASGLSVCHIPRRLAALLRA